MVMLEKFSRMNIKNIPKKIWREFVYGSHMLALGDALVIIALSIVLDIGVNWALPVVVYLSVLAINSFNRYEEYEQDILTNPERSASMKKYIKIFPVLIGSMLIASIVIVIFTADLKALFFMGILFALGILYTVIFKGWTKKVVGFKNFSIALPYSLMVVFAALYYDKPITSAVVLIAVFYYIRIFISAMYFDIKDIDGDKREGLKTFAVIYGKKQTSQILHVLNLLSFIPLLAALILGLVPLFSLGLLLTIPYTAYYVSGLFNKNINQTFLSNVIADGEFIFWLPYIFIGGLIL